VDRYEIGRAEQDAFALASHQKALQADFSAEIVPVPRNKADPVTLDEGPRGDASLESLGKLKPVFRKGGSVTAGNSSTLNDGAAAMLIASPSRARELGLAPIARVKAVASAGVDPRVMGIGPVPAIHKVLAKSGLSLDDIDLIELNEAFAAQSLACVRVLGVDPEKVNVKGGAIALGHPLGCSGARILTTLVHALRERGGRYGVASLCVGVGQGVATLVELVD
jgi:acetyl-CoA acetyltransferase family protein